MCNGDLMIRKVYKVSYEKIFEALLKTANHYNFEIKNIDEERGILNFSSESSLRSWGEDIIISIKEKDSGVALEVESISRIQLLSWGKNKENEEKIIEQLEMIIF